MNKVSIAIILAVIGGTVGAVDYFAKDADLEELAMDFQQERTYNRIDRLEERMWTIKNSYPNNVPQCDWKMDDKEEYRQLEKELERARKEFIK